MADKEFLERMLSMLPEEFQDIYDDTIPEAKAACHLLEKHQAKEIRILTMARTPKNKENAKIL